MRVLLSTAAMTFALASPAIAGDKKPVVDTDKRICRPVGKTGSILPGRKECHTRSEWAQIDGVNQQNARDAGDRNRGAMMPGRDL